MIEKILVVKVSDSEWRAAAAPGTLEGVLEEFAASSVMWVSVKDIEVDVNAWRPRNGVYLCIADELTGGIEVHIAPGLPYKETIMAVLDQAYISLAAEPCSGTIVSR